MLIVRFYDQGTNSDCKLKYSGSPLIVVYLSLIELEAVAVSVQVRFNQTPTFLH